MFLYARIVLDNLEQLHGIDEVRRELKALPTDLTDAYVRHTDTLITATNGCILVTIAFSSESTIRGLRYETNVEGYWPGLGALQFP